MNAIIKRRAFYIEEFETGDEARQREGVTIAVEVPVWLLEHDVAAFEGRRAPGRAGGVAALLSIHNIFFSILITGFRLIYGGLQSP